jgi:hypothetical protein
MNVVIARSTGGKKDAAAGLDRRADASFRQRKEELDDPVAGTHAALDAARLRRTARSFMPKALREIAEHAMGHAIPGVEGVYNRYEYFDEKSQALADLTVLIEITLKGRKSSRLENPGPAFSCARPQRIRFRPLDSKFADSRDSPSRRF